MFRQVYLSGSMPVFYVLASGAVIKLVKSIKDGPLMILSVSRRTDIPSYYSEWFFNRIKEGFLYVRNPMNPAQISKINLSPEVVDCIVFWTKNPLPMLDRLHELSAYHFYFQFTLTGYGKDVEANIPHKRDVMIPVFQKLSTEAGCKKVIWRYDPIIFTKVYTPEYHIKAFTQIAEALNGYTQKCVISFVDTYTKTKRSMEELGAYELSKEELTAFARKLAQIAKENGMTIATCAEVIDLEECGIEHNACIDKKLIEEILGVSVNVGKDKNQRAECGCIESVEVGTYNTCRNGCRYCYANYSPESVIRNCEKYDLCSPILCDFIKEENIITERKVKSFIKKEDFEQITLKNC